MAAQAIARRLQTLPSEGAGAAPVGGSPAQAVQSASEGPKTLQRAGGHGALLAGVADAGIRGALGIKQFFGGLSDEDKAVLREMNAEGAQEKGWNSVLRTTGDIAGNIAMTAVPGKHLATVGNVAKLGRAAPVAASALSSGATEAVLAPGEGESFTDQMIGKVKEAGKAAATGGVLTGALSALSKPFRASAEAVDLMKQGVYPTLAQGSDGVIGKGVGGLTSGVLPIARRQNREVVNEVIRQVRPDLDPKALPDTTEGIVRAMQGVGDEYGQLFQGKKFNMSSKTKGDIWGAGIRAAGRQPDVKQELLERLGGAGNALRSGNNIRFGREGMQLERAYLQDQINRMSGLDTKSGEIKRGLIAAKDKFDELVRNPALSPDELARLSDIDHRYSDAQRVIEAAKSPEAVKQLKVAHLLRGFRDLDPKGGQGFAAAENQMQERLLNPAARVMNLNPNQDQMRSLLVSSMRAGGKAALGAGAVTIAPWMAPAYALSLAGQTKAGSRALFGDYAAQKKLAEYLRNHAGKAAIGSALNDQEDF